MVIGSFVAVGSMNKQINLHRNVSEASQKRRRTTLVVLGIAAATLSIGWGSWSVASFHRSEWGRKINLIEAELLREKTLIDALGVELKKKQASTELSIQAAYAIDVAQLPSRRDNELAMLNEALASWRTDGAALRKVGYESGVLTITGEARGAKQAKFALSDLAKLVSSHSNWILLSQEIREPELDSLRMNFRMIARTGQGAKP